MRILVTGGSGFIGRRAIDRLGTHEVFALTRSTPTTPLGCETVVVPHLDSRSVGGVVAQVMPDAIVHLAAAGVDPRQRDPALLAEVNSSWPAALVRAAGQTRTQTVIVAGSSAEYAVRDGTERLREDATLETHKLYGATKAAGGLIALATGASCGVGVAVLRLFNVFGEGEAPHRLLPSIVSAAREDRAVALSMGTQIRDFVEVDDACRAIEATLEALRSGRMASGAYNVCSGTGTSVADFARLAIGCTGAVKSLLHFGALPMRADDIPWLVGDPTSFEAATGWRARPLTDGLRDAVGRMSEASSVTERPA